MTNTSILYWNGRTQPEEILKIALEKPTGTWGRADEMRVGMILRRLDWKPRDKGERPRTYLPTQPDQKA